VGTRRIVGTAAATAVVGGSTAANRLAGAPLSWWAATPRAVGNGKLWLLVTSGVLADNPWLPSLLGFAIVLVVALHVLSVPQVIGAAALGQIASALLVYGIVGAAHSVDPHVFRSLLGYEDYGVSAIIAAWIGAIARVGWRKYPTVRGRAAVAAGCVVCLLVGLAFRPDVNFLDSEHLVAFAIGAAVASTIPGRTAVAMRRLLAVAAAAIGGSTH
jgi:hypothetical protein